MHTLAGIGVLVELGAVEHGEREPVGREMGRHPVEQHTDSIAVQHVDEVPEIVRAPEPGRGLEEAGDLIAPRTGERVLHDREELDVGEAHRPRILGERLGHLPVVQRPTLIVVPTPRTEVKLVDRHRRVRGLEGDS